MAPAALRFRSSCSACSRVSSRACACTPAEGHNCGSPRRRTSRLPCLLVQRGHAATLWHERCAPARDDARGLRCECWRKLPPCLLDFVVLLRISKHVHAHHATLRHRAHSSPRTHAHVYMRSSGWVVRDVCQWTFADSLLAPNAQPAGCTCIVISCLLTSTFSAFRMVSCSRILNSSSSSSSLSMPYAHAQAPQLRPSGNLTEASCYRHIQILQT